MIALRLPRPYRRAIRRLGRRGGSIVRGDRLFEIVAVCISVRVCASRALFFADRCVSFWMSLCRAYALSNRLITPAVYKGCRPIAISEERVTLATFTVLCASTGDFQQYRLQTISPLRPSTPHFIPLLTVLAGSERIFSPVSPAWRLRLVLAISACQLWDTYSALKLFGLI